MSTDVEKLWDKLSECRAEGMSPRETAEALIAAGWRPPVHVITDADELSALPINAKIITPTDGWRHIGGGWWDTPADNRVVHSESIIGAAEGVGPGVIPLTSFEVTE